MGCVLRGRSKALGVEGHLRQVGIQGYGRLPYGYHVDTLWDTMWSTLWGTLWRPRNPRGYPQNPWILERDSRETQERLERDSRQSPQLPKHGSQRARRVRWGQIQLTQAARAAATRERATRKERVGSELGHEDGVKEEGLSLRLMSVWSVILWDPLGTIGNPWVWKAIWGKCHVTWHVRMHGIKWVTMKTWHDITQPHTITPLQSGPAGPSTITLITNTTLSEQLWRAVNSSNKAVSSSQELSERVQTAPDGAVCTEEWRLPCHSPFFPCWVHGRLDSLLLFSLHASWKETA